MALVVIKIRETFAAAFPRQAAFIARLYSCESQEEFMQFKVLNLSENDERKYIVSLFIKNVI